MKDKDEQRCALVADNLTNGNRSDAWRLLTEGATTRGHESARRVVQFISWARCNMADNIGSVLASLSVQAEIALDKQARKRTR